MQSFSFPDPNDIPADWKRLGRKYRITTEALGSCFTMNGYWLYQPSVILPCSLTGNKFVLLIARNKVANQPETSGLVLVARTSDDGVSFGSEIILLENTSQNVDNICDMIDARPIWDVSNSQWHIYLQARIGTPGQQCANNTAHIIEAVGSSLNPPTSNSFQWVKESGNNHARKIITGTSGSDGIGEGMQWYNPSAYGLPGYPFMVTYNDWGCTSIPFCDQDVFNYLSQDDATYNYWYGPEPRAVIPSPYQPPDWSWGLAHPDAILLGAIDAGRTGNPGIGFNSQCFQNDRRFQYCNGLGFFNNPSKVPFTSPQISWAFAGAMESVASDTNGPRMFRPRVARNECGYIPPQSYHGHPRTWVTYLYYTYTQIEESTGSACDGYGAYDNVAQSVGVSRLTIAEESSQRIQS